MQLALQRRAGAIVALRATSMLVAAAAVLLIGGVASASSATGRYTKHPGSGRAHRRHHGHGAPGIKSVPWGQGATQSPWPEAGGSGDTYFGAIIGRYANRIGGHSFSLNGHDYTLDANNGTNTLHGGYLGWNTVVWDASTSSSGNPPALTLTHDFPAGEGCLQQLSPGCNGFPAPVSATVTYSLTRDNQLKIGYDVKRDMPGLQGPQVEALYERGARWLQGHAL